MWEGYNAKITADKLRFKKKSCICQPYLNEAGKKSWKWQVE